MDLKRLHKATTDALSGNGVNTEMAYAMQALQLLTCPDPLTLDAAKAVVGREPDETVEREDRTRYEWKGMVCDLRLLIWKPDSVPQVLVFDYWHLNPTVGQFALLAAAARMGEKA